MAQRTLLPNSAYPFQSGLVLELLLVVTERFLETSTAEGRMLAELPYTPPSGPCLESLAVREQLCILSAGSTAGSVTPSRRRLT